MTAKHYQTTYLKDYVAPQFEVESLDLHFDLDPVRTLVKSRMQLKKLNRKTDDLVLAGNALRFVDAKLNDELLTADNYSVTPEQLIIKNVPGEFTLEITTEISPKDNTTLMGLYVSRDIFCTQCESHGFRGITYFLDRPDVMTCFTTTIVADKSRYPVLLSNGNLVECGELAGNKHWVTWVDPFKKPSYLFALVAGDLVAITDTFITSSRREVELKVYAERGDEAKCHYAMECIKKAMRWDEETFGREYDLDLYMLVAISDFNMGAMENKGLNVFNTKYILANQDIASDADFEAILGVIGHEYFHNWTGNRVTCRDWFQLSLKEGLTIYRDQEFTADMTSRAVKRIQDVRYLRTYQFPEDAGPMAHPVRPESYIEINNFYTLTVYSKGAEVIRMMATLVGKDGFRKGMDLYFDRHDGEAVTIEDFVSSIEDANKIDLSQFRCWYSEAGTPEVTIISEYDQKAECFNLRARQHTASTPAQKDKPAFLIPIKMSLLDAEGNVMPLKTKDAVLNTGNNAVLALSKAEQVFRFEGIKTKPIPALLHDFSAPINLKYDYSRAELIHLIKHADNLFVRWQACQDYFLSVYQELKLQYRDEKSLTLDNGFINALRENLLHTDDISFVAELFALPSEKYLASLERPINVDEIHHIREFIVNTISKELESELRAAYEKFRNVEPYSLSQEAIHQRKLKNTVLAYLIRLKKKAYFDLAAEQFAAADNMTDRIASLSAVVHADAIHGTKMLDDYYRRYENDDLAIDKWFSVQALSDHPDTFEKVKELTQHPAFSLTNPNRFRSLIAVFAGQNPYHFHRIDGAGYVFLIDFVIKLNKQNPQLAARILEPMTHWRHYDATRKQLMQRELQRLQALPDLSNDIYELVSKSLLDV